MKKSFIALAIAAFVAANSAFAQLELFDTLSPEARKALSVSWADTGKAFQAAGKLKDAKACFLYAVDSYPMGPAAEEARKLLKDSFKTGVAYDTNKLFDFYVKRAKAQKEEQLKLNNYLMALEIGQKADLLYEAAVSAFKLNEKDSAKDLLLKALANGFNKASVSDELKPLLP